MINEEFIPNKRILRIDFYSERNKILREKFFSKYSDEQCLQFMRIWYHQIDKQKNDIPFFLWFQVYLSFLKKKERPLEVNASKKTSIKWSTHTKGPIKANHPPLEPLVYGKKNVQAIPLVSTDRKDSACPASQENIAQLQEQQNYSNLILKTISNQTERIETVLNTVEPMINSIESVVITKQNPLTKPPVEKPTVIPSYIPPNIHLSDEPIKLSDEFAVQLVTRLNTLSLKDTLEKGKTKASSSRSDRSLNNLEEESSSELSSYSEEPVQQTLNSLVKLEPHTTYYHRPTPVDLLNEEETRGNSQYSGSALYEWNLDNLTEYQIATLGHNMLAYANACKI